MTKAPPEDEIKTNAPESQDEDEQAATTQDTKKSKAKKAANRPASIFKAAADPAGFHTHETNTPGFHAAGNRDKSSDPVQDFGLHPQWLKNPPRHWHKIAAEMDKVTLRALRDNWGHIGMSQGPEGHRKPDDVAAQLLRQRIGQLVALSAPGAKGKVKEMAAELGVTPYELRVRLSHLQVSAGDGKPAAAPAGSKPATPK